MPTEHQIKISSGQTIAIAEGTTVLQALQRSGLGLTAACGGAGLCGKCLVRFTRGAPEPTFSDHEKITAQEIAEGFRLACTALMTGDAEIEILQPTQSAAADILIHGQRPGIRPEPEVQKYLVELPPHQITENSSDLEKLLTNLPVKTTTLSLLKKLPTTLRQNQFRGTATVHDHRLIDFESGDQRDHCYGMAVDLGTTTLAAKLIHLPTGRIAATSSALNLQSHYGDDVISRIKFANESADNLKTLQETIIDQINELISTFGISSRQIYEIVFAGNTVMQHLLLGVSPRHLAEMPYVPAFLSAQKLAASELGIKIHPQGGIYVMPGIGRFVGGDTVAVLLTLAEHLNETWLAVDIGTNGEILLCHKGRVWATSAAAGPAFEGAHISQGMRATLGAIDRVSWQQDEWLIHTIGDAPARGICGSGLVDAVGAMLESGILDATGRLNGMDPSRPFVELARHEKEPGVRISQRDLREMQLAKGAIATAIEIIMSQANIAVEALKAVHLAGAFGQYIGREMALRIGLLPAVPKERIHFIGNAACAGAEMALISVSSRLRAEELSKAVEYVEVAADEKFQERFAENMLFPERPTA